MDQSCFSIPKTILHVRFWDINRPQINCVGLGAGRRLEDLFCKAGPGQVAFSSF